MDIIMKLLRELWALSIDKLCDTELFEMALNRKKAKQIVTAKSPQLVKHLIKLFVFNSPENKQHWVAEINNWCTELDDLYLKSNSSKVDSKTMFNWLVYESSPHYDGAYVRKVVRQITAQQNPPIAQYIYDPDTLMRDIIMLLDVVTVDIASDNFFSINDYLPNWLKV
jgi:hypothetical protein